MVWIVIGLILIVAFGPLMWLRPSARERRIGRLRQRAYREGMRVELRRLPGSEVAAGDRVSAGGRLRDTSVESAAYLQPLPRRLRMLPGWRLLRGDHGSPGPVPGWSFEAGKRPEDRNLAAMLDALRPVIEALPDDVVAFEVEPLTVAAYWLEGPGTNPERVDDLASRLTGAADLLAALDARFEEDTEPGNI